MQQIHFCTQTAISEHNVKLVGHCTGCRILVRVLQVFPALNIQVDK